MYIELQVLMELERCWIINQNGHYFKLTKSKGVMRKCKNQKNKMGGVLLMNIGNELFQTQSYWYSKPAPIAIAMLLKIVRNTTPSAGDKAKNKKDQKDKKQNFSDTCSTCSNTTKSEDSRDYGYH